LLGRGEEGSLGRRKLCPWDSSDGRHSADVEAFVAVHVPAYPWPGPAYDRIYRVPVGLVSARISTSGSTIPEVPPNLVHW
jgi:hypothetical protein